MALSANQLEILITARDTATAVIHSVSRSLHSLGNTASSIGGGIVKAFSAVKNAVFSLQTGSLR